MTLEKTKERLAAEEAAKAFIESARQLDERAKQLGEENNDLRTEIGRLKAAMLKLGGKLTPPPEDLATSDELRIPLPNGCTLCCGEATFDGYGGDVTIRDPSGNEILRWVHIEWAEDPETVMGAIFGASLSDVEVLLKNRVLEDGCWNYRKPRSKA